MTEPTNLTAAEARAALGQAERTTAVTERDVRLLTRGSVALAAVMALTVIALRAAGGNTAAFFVTMLLYVVVVCACAAVMTRAKSAPRGFAVVYGFGIGGAGMLTVVAIMVISLMRDHAEPLAWPWVLLFAAVILGMGLATASLISKRSAR